MQRLSYFLHNMDRCEEHYYALYAGSIVVFSNGDLSYSDEVPCTGRMIYRIRSIKAAEAMTTGRTFLSGSRYAAYCETEQTKEKQH